MRVLMLAYDGAGLSGWLSTEQQQQRKRAEQQLWLVALGKPIKGREQLRDRDKPPPVAHEHTHARWREIALTTCRVG